MPSINASPLNSYQKNRLDLAQRLLVGIADARLATIANMQGYDEAEHNLGWQLFNKASGADRPFQHFLTQAEAATQSNDILKAIFREVDHFENIWLPRMRMAISRFIPSEKREEVLAAFFSDLSQEPEGPKVLRSVSVFLGRYRELIESEVAGTPELAQSMAKRGLTDEVIEAMEQKIKRASSMQESPSLPVEAAAIEAANQAQLQAFEELNAWYNDWSTTLRTAFGARDLIHLGLRSIKRKSAESNPNDVLDDEQEL